MPAGAKTDRVTFGLFEADLRSGELWKAGYRVKLPRQPFRVLAMLLIRAGDIVTREDLQRDIWGEHTNVDFDQAIAAAINKVREALGDSPENPRYIQTLTKRGYRFIAPVASAQVELAIALPRQSFQSSTLETEDPVPISPLVDAIQGGSTRVLSSLSTPTSEFKVQTPDEGVNGSGLGHQRAAVIKTSTRTSIKWLSADGHRSWFLYVWLAPIMLALGTIISYVFLPQALPTPPFRIDQVSHYVPISLGPPNPESFLTMGMDGDQVLTSVLINGRPRLSAIDVETAEVRAIEVPDEISANSFADISRNGSRLLLRSQQSTESEQPLWVVPSVGGSGRRVPGVLAHDAAWMPDGVSILYATSNELAVIGPNEDSSKAYAKLPGRAFWLRWSPDGKLLRFTLFDPTTHAAALWEIGSESHTPKPLPIPQLTSSSACCGVWLPDGRSFVFQANDNLWQLQGSGPRAKLVQLTNGPLRFLSPVASRSGSRIFFIGLEPPSGLQQYEPERKAFGPAPGFLAEANRIDYSRDGKWVAWTDIHEKLWRARTDGSDKIRLTSDALEVFLAHWSPDGRRLAVMARKPGSIWQIYLVDASGGKAEALLNEARNAADPGWSPDGASLVFGREPDLMGKESGARTIQVVNLLTHRVEELPSSEGLFSPRWSPDGRWIVALASDQKIVKLYDVVRGRWKDLAATSAADPVWSFDSRAVYIHAFLADREPLLKIEVPTGAIQVIADLGNFPNGEAANYFFGGITPRGAPLVQPRVGTGNLYTLDSSIH